MTKPKDRGEVTVRLNTAASAPAGMPRARRPGRTPWNPLRQAKLSGVEDPGGANRLECARSGGSPWQIVARNVGDQVGRFAGRVVQRDPSVGAHGDRDQIRYRLVFGEIQVGPSVGRLLPEAYAVTKPRDCGWVTVRVEHHRSNGCGNAGDARNLEGHRR